MMQAVAQMRLKLLYTGNREGERGKKEREQQRVVQLIGRAKRWQQPAPPPFATPTEECR